MTYAEIGKHLADAAQKASEAGDEVATLELSVYASVYLQLAKLLEAHAANPANEGAESD